MLQNEVASAAWHGMVWRFLERCSSQVVSLVVSIILARLLLPEQYGIIAMTMIFIALSETLVTSGLGSALIQRSTYHEIEFSTMFWASVVFSLALYLLLFFLAPYISILMHAPDLTIVLRVLGLRLPISAMNSIQQAYVSQQMIFKKFFFSTLSGTISSGVIGLAMAYGGFGVWALVGQNISMTLVNTLALHFLIPWRPTRHFCMAAFRHLYGFSWRVMVTSFIGTCFDQLRGFLIGRYYTAADLAYVNRGGQFPSALASNISTTMQSVLFPAFSHLQGDKAAMRNALRKSMTMGGLVIAGFMAIMAGTADSLIEIVLTEKWMDAVPYMQCLCLLECFGILSAMNLQSIKALGRADIMLKLEFIKKPIYFLFIVVGVFISPFAIVVGNTIYSVLAFIMNAWPNRRLLGYSLQDQWKDCFWPILLSIVVFSGLQVLQTILPRTLVYWGLECLFGFLVYFAAAKLLHILGAEYLYAFLKHKLEQRKA